MVLLLHAANQRGDSTVRGITRCKKLLFVIEEKLGSQADSTAFNYGPFNEEVNDAAHALEVAGFIGDTEPVASGPPSFATHDGDRPERPGHEGVNVRVRA